MSSNPTTNTAVVVGATGIVGRAIAAKLAERGCWRVVGVTRSGGTVPGVDEAIAVDLRDPDEARQRLAPAGGATHLFFAAYLPQVGWAEEVGPNRALLVNAVEGLEAVGAPLRHVTLITGAKYYGVHLGPSAAPAAETEPRHLGPNFYYAQEDYLRSRTDAAWRWTHLVPPHLTGFAAGNPMNLALSVAVYASLVREAGLRLDFPGTAAAVGAMTQIVDAGQLAEAAAWAATTPHAAGEVFNVANVDPTRWSHLWPAFADYFGVPPRRPAPDPALLLHARAGPALEGDGGEIRARPARARVARELGLPRVHVRHRVRHRTGAGQDPQGRLREAPRHGGKLLRAVRRVAPRPDHPGCLIAVAARVTIPMRGS
jgi:nucleoside-diphosphate-sugar epimerase